MSLECPTTSHFTLIVIYFRTRNLPPEDLTTSFDNMEFIFIRGTLSSYFLPSFKALFFTANRYHVHFKLANKIPSAFLFLSFKKAKVEGKKCLINVYCFCSSRLLLSFSTFVLSLLCSNEGGNRIN